MLLIFSLLQLLSSYTCYSIVFHLPTITLKVKGTGERQVLGYYDSSYKFDSKDYPNEIYINGIKQNEVKLKYNFNQTDNHVVFIWNNSIKNCYEMFSNCQYITEIDFSNFNTSTVTKIDFMFFGCKSLEYINIQNSTDIKFAQLKVDYEDYFLQQVPSNIEICVNNEKTSTKMYLRLKKTCKGIDCSYDWSLHQKKINAETFTCIDDCSKISQYEYNEKCYHQCPSGTINNNNICIDCDSNCKECDYNISYCTSCKDSNKYLDNGKCVSSCPYGYYTDNANNICCPLEKCSQCSKESLSKNACTSCFDGYYPIYNNSQENDYFDCYKELNGYYLDKNDTQFYFKECYSSCQNCEIGGNSKYHNCKECKSDYEFEIEFNSYKNCYKKCDKDKENQLNCTSSLNCPKEYDKLIEEKGQCVKECYNDSMYKYEYENHCYEKCPNGTKESNSKNYFCEVIEDNSNKLSNIIDSTIHLSKNEIELLSAQNKLNKDISQFIHRSEIKYRTNFIITGNNEEVYQEILNNVKVFLEQSTKEELIFQGEDNSFFHITNSESGLDILKGKSNSTNKLSVIDLGKCGNLLKKHYHINENDSLLIMKFEKVSDNSSERFLQYEVYEPYNKTKLNLSICNNITIDVYIPIVLNEKTQNLYNELKDLGYDLFDINSPFYQDICTPYKSSDGTDVLLNDRVNSYYNNDQTTCQSNCKFSDYLVESQYLKCDCDIQNSGIDTEKTNEFNTKSLYQSFFSVLKYSNYKVLKCVNLAFIPYNVTKNIESIIALIFYYSFNIFNYLLFKRKKSVKNKFNKKIGGKIRE